MTVPVDLWHEIESERKIAYLLKSETMRQRLLIAKKRQEGVLFDETCKNLEFDSAGFEDFAWLKNIIRRS